MTLDDIKARCVITDDGHWIWKGALSDDRWPRIWAPDHTVPGSPKKSQTGRRAVWHLKTGKAIPDGHLVFGTCTEPQCLNPAHMDCGSTAAWGAQLTKAGTHQTMQHRVAARLGGQRNSVLTPETYALITSSPKSGREIARELGVSEQTVSKARNGRLLAFQPVASPFAGLGAR